MPETFNDALEQVAVILRDARRVAVLTGAGMSAASGLPTYRGIGGLYNDFEIEQGMPIEEILHASTLARDPALCWKYIAKIAAACRGAQPNAGHTVLAAWDARFDLHVITQNVDGFHRRAGSRNVIELHGNLGDFFCLDCAARFDATTLDVDVLPPRCIKCDGLVRPNVVLFGEMLPPQALQRYEHELMRGFDVIFAIGTTAGFPYIHDPIVTAARRGVATVEINPDVTPLSEIVAHRIMAPADTALSQLDRLLA